MMKDVIFENTAEEDMTPDSEEMIKPLSKANLRERKESFKTHAFESKQGGQMFIFPWRCVL